MSHHNRRRHGYEGDDGSYDEAMSDDIFADDDSLDFAGQLEELVVVRAAHLFGVRVPRRS